MTACAYANMHIRQLRAGNRGGYDFLVISGIDAQEARMSRNTSVSPGDHFVSFIDAQVKGGRYGSASDVVRAGLRLLEEHEAKVKALQDALIAGEDSGRAEDFDLDQFIARKMAGPHP
jgi:antitoxin ParD1/3/4